VSVSINAAMVAHAASPTPGPRALVSSRSMYVAVAGTIGAGKSTLTRLLAERYHLRPVFEAVDENPYLADFYGDMRRWAFHSQMFFLATRLEQHLAQVNPGERVIQDRTVDEDAQVFAQALFEDGMIDARDFDVYTRTYRAVRRALRVPDLMVYVRASLPTVKRHIALRGRGFEQNVPDAYLMRLEALYERWASAYGDAPMVVVDADRFDVVASAADREAVFDLLERNGLSAPVMR
jgi:deoxyadenosine/deoxycytidine kinase